MATSTQKKIRVGLVGLNAPFEGMPTGVNWAARTHLQYLLSSPKYELVALLNSSAERAAKSIKEHGLDPKKVKAYGNAEGKSNQTKSPDSLCSFRGLQAKSS